MSAASDRRHSNSEDGSLEFRVFAGVHAGAAVEIAPGQVLSVGSSPDNDICLVDAPFASARLATTDSGWSWYEPDSDVSERIFGQGRGLRAGGLCVSVEGASTRWRTLDSLTIDYERVPAEAVIVETSPPSTGAGEASVARADTAAATASTDGAPAQGAPVSGDNRPANGLAADSPKADGYAPGEGRIRGRRVGGPRTWWLAPGAIVVGMAWFAAHTVIRWIAEEETPPPAEVVAVAAARPATADDLERVESILISNGFSDVVKARLRSDGRIEVLGVLENVDELDQVVRMLAAERQWLAIRLLSQTEFIARVAEVSRTLQGAFEGSALPGGRVLLSGFAVNVSEIEQAQRTLSEALPEMTMITLNVSRPADVARQLAAQFRDKGLNELAVSWSGAHVIVEGGVPRSAERVLESVLLGFHAAFGDRLAARVNLSFLDSPGNRGLDAAASLPPPKLPRIVAIQSGSHSYLLFADGNRVLPGGVVNGYRLTTIDDDSVLFEDRDGNQHRVTR